MKIASNISKVFGLQRIDLADEEQFNTAMKTAIDATKERFSADPSGSSQMLQPILKFLEKCKEAKQDCILVLGKALEEIGPVPHLKKELRDQLMQCSHVSKEALPALARYAQQDLFNITLWRRLIEDFTFYDKIKSASRMKMAYFVNIAPHFPDHRESTWYDMETEEEAKKYLEVVYQELLMDFKPEWTRLDISVAFAEVLTKFRPYDDRAAMAIALIFAGQKEVLRSRLPLVESAWEAEPDKHLLKRYVGLAWAEFESELRGMDAFTILQDIFATDPDDKAVEEALVGLVGKLDLRPEEKLNFMKGLSESHKDNLHYKIDYVKTLARHDPQHPTVLRLITEVMAYAPMDNDLQYLQAIVMIQQQNSVQAVGILERIYQRDPENAQIAKALSECYAAMGRKDSRAMKIYRQAVENGSTDEQLLQFHLVELLENNAPFEEFEKAKASVDALPQDSTLRKIIELKLSPKTKLADFLALIPNAAENELEWMMKEAGHCLAQDTNRTNVRQVIALPPKTAAGILEQAYADVPDSNMLALQLVKSRLAINLHDQKTIDLLAQVCRAEPDEIELRIKRAELMNEMGQKKAALAIYQELFDRKALSSRSSSSTAVYLDWDQMKERILEQIFQITLSLEEPEHDDLDFIYKHLQSPNASIELLIDMARRPLGRYTHPCQQVVMEKANIISPDDEIILRNLAIVRLTFGNTGLFEMRWEKASAEEKETIVDQLEKRLKSLRKKKEEFVLPDSVGVVLGRCQKTFTDYKRENFQNLIAEYCE
jgi:thioredoxin-like negative regulator of GroEL